jgi:hypothetical protein
MKCFRAKKLLSSYLEGYLDKHSSLQLEEHLAGCVACRRQMDDLTMLVDELKSLEPVKAPPDFLDQIHARLEPRRIRHNFAKKLFHPWRIKIPLELASAAALALLIVAVISIQKEQEPIFQKPQTVVSRSALERETDKKVLSRPLEKVRPMPTAEQRNTDRKKTEVKSIVLVLQDIAWEPSPEAAAGPEETENGPLTRFLEPKPADQKPGEDKIKKRAPVKSLSVTDTVDQDKRGIIEKHRSDTAVILSRIQALIQSVAGNIISERETGRTQDLRQITVDIPIGRYPEFIDKLNRIAPFQTPPPPITLDQDSIRIQIRLIVSQKQE